MRISTLDLGISVMNFLIKTQKSNNIGIVANLLTNRGKSLKLNRFESVQNLVSFYVWNLLFFASS